MKLYLDFRNFHKKLTASLAKRQVKTFLQNNPKDFSTVNNGR